MPLYQPEPVPFGDGSAQELRDYIFRELLRLSGILSKYPFIQIEEHTQEPGKVQDGTVLWADGTEFDPGEGAGFYGRRGSAWYKFDNNGGAAVFSSVSQSVNNSGLVLNGGITNGSGANVELYGGTHASFANHAYYDAVRHHFRDVDATPTFMTLDADALVLTSGRLEFPATMVPSSDPNTMDDVERGTWTPTYTPSAGAFGAHTFTTRNAQYEKFGRQVWVKWNMLMSTYVVGTASGTITITGLPFSLGDAHTACPIWANAFATNQPWPVGLLTNGQVNVYNGTSSVAGPTAAFPVANMANTCQLYGSAVYHTT